MDIFKVEVSKREERLKTVKPVSRRGALADNTVFLLLIFATFLLPLFFLPYQGVAMDFTKSLLLAGIAILALIVWIVARLRDGAILFPKSAILVAGLGIVFVFFLSAITSPVPSVSFTGFIFEPGTFASTTFLFLLMFLGAAIFQSYARTPYFYGAIILSFVVVFFFHLLRAIFGVDFLSFGFFTANTGTPVGKWNDLAIFSGLIALISLMALELAAHARIKKLFFYVVLVMALILLVVVGFSPVWAALAGISFVLAAYHLFLRRFIQSDPAESRMVPVAALALLLVSTSFLFAGDPISEAIVKRANISQVEVRPAWGTTAAIARETWKENFLLGSGPNRFTPQWLKYKPDNINNSVFWSTDFRSGVGLIPSFAITTGALGLLAWIVFFACLLFAGTRLFFSSLGYPGRYLALSAFAVAVYLWVMAILYVPSISLVALAFLATGIFVGTLARLNLTKNATVAYAREPRVGFVSVLALMATLVFSSIVGYGIFQKTLGLALFQNGRSVFNEEGDLQKARDLVVRAAQHNPSDAIFRGLVQVEIARLNQILNKSDASIEQIRDEFQTTLGSAIEAGQRAIQADETNYQNHETLASVYAAIVPLNIAGAYENAKANYDRARELNPKGPALALREAQLEIMRGDLTAARERINEALALKNNYTDAIFLLSQLEINEGNAPQAITALEQVSLINPNNPGVFFQLGLLRYSTRSYKEAALALERAVALSPNYANAKYFLGLSYHQMGRADEALREFRDVQALNPDNEEVRRIIGNIESEKAVFDGIVPPAVPPEERPEPPIGE